MVLHPSLNPKPETPTLYSSLWTPGPLDFQFSFPLDSPPQQFSFYIGVPKPVTDRLQPGTGLVHNWWLALAARIVAADASDPARKIEDLKAAQRESVTMLRQQDQ